MFSLFKKAKPCELLAVRLYKEVMEHSRQPVFYERLGVPDTMNGRFDLLLLHLFFVVSRILESKDEPDDLAQALFDVAFENIDEALRENGVGDMGIKKRMKRMMMAFNGRMHAYDEALKHGRAELQDVLQRNLYAGVDALPKEALGAMADYVYKSVEGLAAQELAAIREGRIVFIDAGQFVTRDILREAC